MGRVWGTWLDGDGVRHCVTGFRNASVKTGYEVGKHCTGGYVGATPDFGDKAITCLRCIWRLGAPVDRYGMLRGQRADTVIYDEVDDIAKYFEISTVTKPADRS